MVGDICYVPVLFVQRISIINILLGISYQSLTKHSDWQNLLSRILTLKTKNINFGASEF